MTKEVTFTKIKLAKMEMVDGQLSAVTLPDEVVIGNVSLESAQRQIRKSHGQGITVFAVEPETQMYKMLVEDFLKHAELVTDGEQEELELAK